MTKKLVKASLVALICTAAAVPVATARTPYDGAWSVLIVTQRGTCDRAYRYGIQIVNGNVVYDGGIVNFSGRVSPGGAVRVAVSSSKGSASGSGRMSANAARGSWSGRSSNDTCSGYWTAERR